jgi:DNA-binding NtrC family response regulator
MSLLSRLKALGAITLPEDAVRKPVVLHVTPSNKDAEALNKMVGGELVLRRVESLAEAVQTLADDEIDVVITDTRLPDGVWTALLTDVKSQAPIIVTSATADERLWAEVLNLGGYDLLVKPFHRTEVLRVIQSAWKQSTYRTERRRSLALRAAGMEPPQ